VTEGRPDLFRRFLEADPGRLHFAAHSHHPWPDISFDAQQRYWLDSADGMDRSIGRILKYLDDNGLTQNTVVFFHSDNGGYGPATSMAPLRGSKGMLHEGGIRVPLVVRWPGSISTGFEDETPVIGIDLFPTIAEMTGTTPDLDTPLDGVSLYPLLSESPVRGSENAAWETPHYHGCRC